MLHEEENDLKITVIFKKFSIRVKENKSHTSNFFLVKYMFANTRTTKTHEIICWFNSDIELITLCMSAKKFIKIKFSPILCLTQNFPSFFLLPLPTFVFSCVLF